MHAVCTASWDISGISASCVGVLPLSQPAPFSRAQEVPPGATEGWTRHCMLYAWLHGRSLAATLTAMSKSAISSQQSKTKKTPPVCKGLPGAPCKEDHGDARLCGRHWSSNGRTCQGRWLPVASHQVQHPLAKHCVRAMGAASALDARSPPCSCTCSSRAKRRAVPDLGWWDPSRAQGRPQGRTDCSAHNHLQ